MRFIVGVLGAAWVGVVGAQAPLSLKLNISFDKVQWVAPEPVIAYVGVENVGQTVAQVRLRPQPEFRQCTYTISSGGRSQTFVPWAIKDVNAQPQGLAPGDHLAFPVKLYFGANGFAFGSPGDYDVQVACPAASSPATTHVRVVAPSGPIEAQQSNQLLANADVGYFFLYDGADHLTMAKTLLETVAATSTVFQPYARLFLGVNAAKDFSFPSRGAVRRADPDLARAYLTGIADAGLPKYYRLLRGQLLEEIALKAGDASLAQRYRNEMTVELQQAGLTGFVRGALNHAFAR